MPSEELDRHQASIVSLPHTDEHYVIVPPEVTLASLDRVLSRLEELGLEMMDEDECPSELLEDGSVRVWCAVIDGGS